MLTRSYLQRVWFAGAVAAVVIVGTWLLASLFKALLVLFAGVLIGIFLAQLSGRLAERTSLRYGVAFGIVVAAILCVAGAGVVYMGSQVAQRVGEFLEEFEDVSAELRAAVEQSEWWSRLRRFTTDRQQADAASQAVSTATHALAHAAAVIGGSVLVVVLGFYFALQAEYYRDGCLALFPRESRPRVRRTLEQLTHVLWRWILGRLFAMIVVGVGAAVGLAIIGIPLAGTLGALAGLLNFIPNVGPILAAIPAVLFALQQDTSLVLYVIVFYSALQFVEGNLLTPLIDQHQVFLPPGLILSAQLIIWSLAGLLGLLLATPLTVVIYVLVRDLYVDRK